MRAFYGCHPLDIVSLNMPSRDFSHWCRLIIMSFMTETCTDIPPNHFSKSWRCSTLESCKSDRKCLFQGTVYCSECANTLNCNRWHLSIAMFQFDSQGLRNETSHPPKNTANDISIAGVYPSQCYNSSLKLPSQVSAMALMQAHVCPFLLRRRKLLQNNIKNDG